MGYVFISYSSQNKTEADAVRSILLQKGIECWMAPYSILPGEKYAGAITRGIRDCACLMLLLTEAAQASDAVDKEVERAIHYRKPLLAVQLEDLVLSDNFEYYLSNSQIVSVAHVGESDPTFANVLRIVTEFCGTTTPSAASVTTPAKPAPAAAPCEESAEELFRQAESYRAGAHNFGRPDYGRAVSCYQKAADLGYAPAWMALAMCYSEGECGLEEDEDKAVAYCEKAAELGSGEACFLLGNELYYDVHDEEASKKALAYFERGRALGSADAATKLGDVYLYGNVCMGDKYVKIHDARALLYYLEAAEAGHAEAADMVAYCFEHGHGLPDAMPARALYWYEKAAAGGYESSAKDAERMRTELANMKKPDEEKCAALCRRAMASAVADREKALELLVEAMEEEYAPAYFLFADVLSGADESDEESLQYLQETLEMGAALGNVDCAAMLGTLYLSDEILETDYDKALPCLILAAEQGNADAQFMLGGCCRMGFGLPGEDDQSARFWLTKAAAAGSADAKEILDEMNAE